MTELSETQDYFLSEIATLKRQRDELLATLLHIRVNLLGFKSLSADQAKFKLGIINTIATDAIARTEADQ